MRPLCGSMTQVACLGHFCCLDFMDFYGQFFIFHILGHSRLDLCSFACRTMPYTKPLASKCPQERASPPSIPQFANDCFQEHYNVLKRKPFAQTHTFDWETFEHLGLVDDIWWLVGFDHLLSIFKIDKLFYEELTLEVHSTFKIDSVFIRLC